MVCLAPPCMPSMPMAAYEPSSKKNPYRIIRELGSGLQGRVMLAFDEINMKHVAIKLPAALASSPAEPVDQRMLGYQNRSIMIERDAHRRVNDRNVLKYVRLMPGSKQNHNYVAMVTEYASNGDLFDSIADSGAMPEFVAKYYFHQLLSGVQACHNSGVIHRDIKPENILFDDEFTLKVCDFGLAATTMPGETAENLMLQDVAGTAQYMAPEISVVEPYRATPVDVWSCGLVLFIMLTSYPAFQEAEEGDYWYDCIMGGHMDEFWSAQPKSMVKPNADAIDLINRMLTVDPTQRITINEILTHPWLRDVGDVSHASVAAEMRRRQSELLDFGI